MEVPSIKSPPQVDVLAQRFDGETVLHALAGKDHRDWDRPPEDQAVLVRAMRLLVAAGVRLSCAGPLSLAQALLNGKQLPALRWLAEEVGAAVAQAAVNRFGRLHSDGAALDEWEAIRGGQRRRFRAAAEVLRRAARGDACGADEAAAQTEGGAGRLLCCAVDEHGRRLLAAASALHPEALAWARGWEARLLEAWAMAGHGRLGAQSPARALGDEVLRWIGELVVVSALC